MTEQANAPEGSDWGMNLETVHCPNCNEQMPALRLPKDMHQLVWGGWTCPKCDTRMDKWGQPLKE